MEAQKFREFITEGEVKPYRFVLVWYDDPEDPDEPEKTADKIIDEGKKLGCTGFKVDINGAYSDITEKGEWDLQAKYNIGKKAETETTTEPDPAPEPTIEPTDGSTEV